VRLALLVAVPALAAFGYALLVVGVVRPVWHRHRSVGTAPRAVGPVEVCVCGAERPCRVGHGSWRRPSFKSLNN